MPPSRHKEHEWTKFELQTMLSLIARGAHIAESPGKRTDSADLIRNNAYEKFATLFNEAVHGKFNYGADIDKREIVRMLDSLMAKRTNVVGKNGLVERQRCGRITRSLRLAWERSDGRDFDGSLAEWEGGRREMVIRKDMTARGLIPQDHLVVEGGAVGGSKQNLSSTLAFRTYTSEPTQAPAAYARKYTSRVHQKASVADPKDQISYLNRQLEKVHAAAASTSRAAPNRGKKSHLSAAYINDADEDDDLDTVVPSIPNRALAPATLAKKHDAVMNNLSSFAVLPSKIRDSGKFEYMNTGRTTSGTGTPGRIGVAGEVVKLKRPGRNAGRMDTYFNKVTKSVGTPSRDAEADTVKAKGLGGGEGRMDVGFLTGRTDNTVNTDAHMSTQVNDNSQHTSSDFLVQSNSRDANQFQVQRFSNTMDLDADGAFDGDEAEKGTHGHSYGGQRGGEESEED